MMMEAAPVAALVVAKAKLLLELLIVPLDPPARLGNLDQALERGASGRLENQYFAGSASPAGHSISSHSSGQGSARWVSRCAGRTRTAAKREDSLPWLPSRQVTVRQAWAARLDASALSVTGWFCASRRSRVGRRPRPDQGSGGSGSVPGAQTLVPERTPST